MVRRDRGMGCNERNTRYLETRVFEYLLVFQTVVHSASKSNLKKSSNSNVKHPRVLRTAES